MKSIVLPLFLFFSLPVFCAERLAIDAHHSAVVFSWNHHGITHPVARFEQIEGKLVLDDSDLTKSSVTVKLALDGLRTGVDALDKRLKTAEFLDAAKYPDISFTSTSVEKGPMDTLKIAGKLSLHGVTKAIVLDAKINKISPDRASKTSEAGFDATATIKRADFGVDKFLSSVADELLVRITLGANSEE